jgi:hypothetical protein
LGNQGLKPLQKCITITKFSTILKVSVQYKLVIILKYNKNNGIRKNNFKIFTEQRFSGEEVSGQLDTLAT